MPVYQLDVGSGMNERALDLPLARVYGFAEGLLDTDLWISVGSALSLIQMSHVAEDAHWTAMTLDDAGGMNTANSWLLDEDGANGGIKSFDQVKLSANVYVVEGPVINFPFFACYRRSAYSARGLKDTNAKVVKPVQASATVAIHLHDYYVTAYGRSPTPVEVHHIFLTGDDIGGMSSSHANTIFRPCWQQ
ncbi:hypothetical protein K491DRAFT_723627 [Lophiostoma macrostomum CBS 122681]|uniref:Uncharacterized protein n=1 Tax=Lophiostoma macrostomum CBS 122681 TaxID=1314788 RepID=A0A6A6SH72_9PLEO|nr:hypothetical protein K491DRAFT_723627 [Lophiostoma macrostomum CBS 122681]